MSSFRLRYYDWFWAKPALMRLALTGSILFGLRLTVAAFLREPLEDVNLLMPTFQTVGIALWKHPRPEPGTPKPAEIDSFRYWALKSGRWLVAFIAAPFLAYAVMRLLDSTDAFGSRMHIAWSVMALWPLAAVLPFWQPNRWRSPEDRAMPPFPPLEFPDRPALS
jgi:hypothetical protein